MLCRFNAHSARVTRLQVRLFQGLGVAMITSLAGFTLFLPAEAITPLKGSASINEALPPDGKEATFEPAVYGNAKPYYPKHRTILKADGLAENFKLQAAESLYWQVLQQDYRNAGAWNGLGKVAFYKTTSSNQNLRSKQETLIQDAIQYFLSALRYQPGYVEAHLNLASVYMEQKRMGEAADEIARAMRLAPYNADVLAKKGEWLVRSQQYGEAIPYLKVAIKANSASAAAHYHLAVAQAARNELDASLQNLNTTLWLDPRNASAHYQMALIYEKQGNGAAAVEHYLQAVSLKPEMEKARLKLADYYERRGDTAATLEQLKNVIDSAEPSWELTDRVGKLSVANNQPEVAVQYYRQWMEEHPEDKAKASAALSFAKTELSKKKLRDNDLTSQGEAKRYAEQALRYEPNNFEARMINAKLDREIGSPSPLQGKDPGMIDVALQQAAYYPYQSFEKGEMLLARYQFREAEQSFRIARRTGEGNRSQMVFGELFLAKGLPTLAEEAFQQVLRQMPGNPSAHLGIAKAERAREDAMELVMEARQNSYKSAVPVAIMQLERALKSNVKNSQAHYLLAQLYERTDAYGPAADHYYAYLQLEPQAKNANSVRRKIENLKQRLGRQSTQVHW
jgi:Tfp pilus assembly protein PilF